jgi:hypothetical protein
MRNVVALFQRASARATAHKSFTRRAIWRGTDGKRLLHCSRLKGDYTSIRLLMKRSTIDAYRSSWYSVRSQSRTSSIYCR